MKPLIAIYDFAIRPYSVGDICIWNIQTAARALESGHYEVDVLVCAEPENPSIPSQRSFITHENFQNNLLELLPIFFCHPLCRHVHVFSERKSFCDFLEKAAQSSEHNNSVVQRHFKLFTQHASADFVNNLMLEDFYDFRFLNEFYKKQSLPQLRIPRGVDKDLLSFRRFLGEDKIMVTMAFRNQRLDMNGRPPEEVDLSRDADVLMWIDLVKTCTERYPQTFFVLLGRIQDKPLALLRLNNVVIPRVLGFTLAHELSLLSTADLILSSNHGFAAAAFFTRQPYILTKFRLRECSMFDILEGSPHMGFGASDQTILYEEEKFEVLLDLVFHQLEKCVKTKNLNSKSGITPSDPIHPELVEQNMLLVPPWIEPAGSTSRFYVTMRREEEELAYYLFSKLVAIHQRMTADPDENLQKELDTIEEKYPQIVPRLSRFHFLRAVLFTRQQKWKEAFKEIQHELLLNPSDQTALSLRTHIWSELNKAR